MNNSRYALAHAECEALVSAALDLLETANAVWVAHGYSGNRAGKCWLEAIMRHQMREYTGVTADALAVACDDTSWRAEWVLNRVNARLGGASC